MTKARGAELLRAERERRKLSQQEASKLIGIRQYMISMYENGKSLPSMATAKKIAETLGIPMEAWT